ncbi:MAG: FAD-dependent oxidoreductase [Rhodospirillaceae bacterium]|jgi:NADPH-dependent glutamate synthase beta subunit-like oxidoreductase|nr:FAD-dependent oxidoreductase [Rhodospirillaceae bacterium]MBT6405876.1 FAD-dependent oxidoreductase [Rhodospirillaceae bacterium]MBT6536530.1 FAD-dependent oxidoreductase [Rhodospirillaceae bacterium]MBT7361033.1 FAD-dependent oxidoreductase [Rhodospirillaceae bacterium]
MSINVAVIGAGPSGFYTVDALLKGDKDVRVDIIERLPTPFGLIRGGVAPDHQTTKKVARVYEKTALRDGVGYYGNVEVGRDVTMAELQEMYDAIVLAVGAPRDRKLGIPGEDKAGVFGSADFVGWYNGHPDFTDLQPDLNTGTVVVIGQGNVAVDVARVLVKTPEEMTDTDIADHAADAVEASPITDVYMVGRRGPIEAKFTNVELREMGKLDDCQPIIDAGQLPEEVTGDWSDRDKRLKDRNLATMKEFPDVDPAGKSKRVHFSFYAKPIEILGGDKVEGIRMEHTRVEDGRSVGTGEFFEIECGLVIPAIGYFSDPFPGVPFDADNGIVVHDEGRVGDGVYAVGWIKRGPTGVIGTNKPDGDIAATQIFEDVADGTKPGREALEALLAERNVRCLTYQDWQSIDASEVAAAKPGAPRRKFVTIDTMIAALD